MSNDVDFAKDGKGPQITDTAHSHIVTLTPETKLANECVGLSFTDTLRPRLTTTERSREKC